MTPEALKRATPPKVLSALADGLGVARGENGGWHCPFHDDSTPSLGIFAATRSSPVHGRWKCQGCGRHGDALALVRSMRGLNLGAAMEWLASWLENTAADSFSLPTGASKAGADPDIVRRYECRYENAVALTHDWLCGDKKLDVDAEWVVKEFRLGADKGELILPCWRANGEEESRVSIAIRYPPWQKRDKRAKGPIDALYGEWRDRGQSKVVLCEGESDTLAVSWWLRERKRILVMGGRGKDHPLTDRIIGMLSKRAVVLLPDADRAGQGWARAWRTALGRSGADVRVAGLPAGTDACLAGQRAVWRALRRSS